MDDSNSDMAFLRSPEYVDQCALTMNCDLLVTAKNTKLPVDIFRQNRFEYAFARLVVSNHCGAPYAASPAVLDGFNDRESAASEQELDRTDGDISRRKPGAISACQIAPCHD
jgi:hypothetical protein